MTKEEAKLMIDRKAPSEDMHTVMESEDVEKLLEIVYKDFENYLNELCKMLEE